VYPLYLRLSAKLERKARMNPSEIIQKHKEEWEAFKSSKEEWKSFKRSLSVAPSDQPKLTYQEQLLKELLEKSEDFVSTEELSESLGITKKHLFVLIFRLRDSGKDIVSLRGKGYKLCKSS
jgi:biotin operon repressor